MKRSEFDKQITLEKEATMREKKEKEAEKEEKQQEEIKIIRQQMIFKASKILKGKPIEIKRSETPLTIPQPPSLTTEKRAAKNTKETK